MKTLSHDHLLQVYNLDICDTCISLIDTDSFYNEKDFASSCEYSLWIFNSVGHRILTKQISVAHGCSQLIDLRTLLIENKLLSIRSKYGIFCLLKLTGKAKGHFYTTYTDSRSGDTFTVHSHQVLKTKPQYLSINDALRRIYKYLRLSRIRNLRVLAIPFHTSLLSNMSFLHIYNKSYLKDRYCIWQYTGKSKKIVDSGFLRPYESKLIRLNDILDSDFKLESKALGVSSALGHISTKPLVFNSTIDSIVSINHC